MTDRGEKEIVKTLHSIADSLSDMRAMLRDLAPVKTFDSNGEIVSKSSSLIDEMINKAINDKKEKEAKS